VRASRSFPGWKALLILSAAASFTAAGAETAARVEARSADLVAVGLVHGDTMSIHVSRSLDNAPVRDAAITVALRGTVHPTSVETDGSYTFHSKDLTLPGAAAVEFQVNEPGGRASLKGTLDIAAASGQSEVKNSSRQLWWWVLNFAVCIGVLMLISRRRKAAQNEAVQK
jgi:hypothetical protein